MRFLANENVPRASVRRLRLAGHDVAAVGEDIAGSSDDTVLARAVQEARIIITFDRDYGELIYRRKLPAPPGVVYLRFDPATPEEPAELLLRLLALPDVSLAQRFTVLERQQVRQRASGPLDGV